MSDPGSTYRTRDEISQIRQLRDPVEHVRKLLTDNNLASVSELKAIEKVNARLEHHISQDLSPHKWMSYCNLVAPNMSTYAMITWDVKCLCLGLARSTRGAHCAGLKLHLYTISGSR